MAKLDVVGVAEVSELLGVSKARVRQLARTLGFPEPAARLAAGPIWERSDIRRWKREWPRRTGRPPRTRSAWTVPGLVAVLRSALAPVSGIEEAFVFGSEAKGTAGPDSDIDVFVIGKPDWLSIGDAVRPVEERLGREVHVISMRRPDVDARLESGSGFVTSVLSGPRLPLLP
jgi:predicted nucleotidyltransferase